MNASLYHGVNRFSNARVTGGVYTVIAKKFASNINVNQQVSVYSHGHYACDCSEGALPCCCTAAKPVACVCVRACVYVCVSV